jgi:hypothetical protein
VLSLVVPYSKSVVLLTQKSKRSRLTPPPKKPGRHAFTATAGDASCQITVTVAPCAPCAAMRAAVTDHTSQLRLFNRWRVKEALLKITDATGGSPENVEAEIVWTYFPATVGTRGRGGGAGEGARARTKAARRPKQRAQGRPVYDEPPEVFPAQSVLFSNDSRQFHEEEAAGVRSPKVKRTGTLQLSVLSVKASDGRAGCSWAQLPSEVAVNYTCDLDRC